MAKSLREQLRDAVAAGERVDGAYREQVQRQRNRISALCQYLEDTNQLQKFAQWEEAQRVKDADARRS